MTPPDSHIKLLHTALTCFNRTRKAKYLPGIDDNVYLECRSSPQTEGPSTKATRIMVQWCRGTKKILGTPLLVMANTADRQTDILLQSPTRPD